MIKKIIRTAFTALGVGILWQGNDFTQGLAVGIIAIAIIMKLEELTKQEEQ